MATEPKTTIPRDGELVDYDGCLALFLGASAERDEPYYKETLFVSNIPAFQYEQFIGARPQFPNGMGHPGYLYTPGSFGGHTTILDLNDWKVTYRMRPIPKPRDGKEYTWKYELYQWRQESFARCETCGRWHRPDWDYCETCYCCHAVGGLHRDQRKRRKQ